MPSKQSRRNFFKLAGGGVGMVLVGERSLPAVIAKGSSVTPVQDQALAAVQNAQEPEFDAGPFHNKRPTGGDVIINAVDVELKKETVSSIHNLTVYADVVRVIGTISLPGKNVFIHARRIVGGEGAVIDVTGLNATDYAGDTAAQHGQSPGAPGTGGRNGARGNDGGKITIIAGTVANRLSLVANGGAGFKGERGGNGQQGGQGGPGPDRDDRNLTVGTNLGGKGGRGHRGGDAGPGGNGGAGGKAGVIEVSLIETPPSGVLTYRADGGGGGDRGGSGTPGPGGPGGVGGRNRHCELRSRGRDPGIDYLHCPHVSDRGESGDRGDSGSTANHGAPGDKGTTTYNPVSGVLTPRNINWRDLGAKASISQMLMLLHHTEVEYLNERYENPEHYRSIPEVLAWMDKITRDSPGTQTPAVNTYGSPSLSTVVPTSAEWTAIRSRVLLLASQLRAGLDFYGLPRNHVPSVNLSTYQNAVRELIDIGRNIERTHNEYYTKGLDRRVRQARLQDGINAARNTLEQLRSERQRIDESIPTLASDISDLTVRLDAHRVKLVAAGNELEEEIRRKTGGWSLLDLLGFATSVIAVSQGGLAGIRNIGRSLDKLSDTQGSIPDIIKTIKAIDPDVQAVRNAYNTVRDRVQDLRSNEVKLAVSLETYEQILSQYRDLGSAQRYREIVTAYFDVARTRNQKILDHTALVLRRENLVAEISQREEEIRRLQSVLALTDSPSQVEATTFMGRLLTEAKSNIIRLLYQEHRAYEFSALTTEGFNIWDQNIDGLAAVHGRIVDKQLRAAEARGRNPQPTKFPVTISARDYPEAFEEFRRTGKLVFTLSEDHAAFARRGSSITVSEVTVALPRARVRGDVLTMRLTHSGRSRFVDAEKKLIEFSHQPRPTQVIYNVRLDYPCPIEGAAVPNNPPAADLGGPAYSYLSPFTLWTLTVDPTTPGLRLNDVREVRLCFTGFSLPFREVV